MSAPGRRLGLAQGLLRGVGHADFRPTLVLLLILAIAALFLLSEHRAHALSLLPLLLLFACPLLPGRGERK